MDGCKKQTYVLTHPARADAAVVTAKVDVLVLVGAIARDAGLIEAVGVVVSAVEGFHLDVDVLDETNGQQICRKHSKWMLPLYHFTC